MNFTNKEEVVDALKTLSIDLQILSFSESKKLSENVLKRFTLSNKYTYPLWENIVNRESIKYPYAWEVFGQILKNEKVILFFEFEDDQVMFLFEDGAVLTQVLENCFRFVFYITNVESEFLLAFNDHDYLIGAGRALRWIQEIKDGDFLP